MIAQFIISRVKDFLEANVGQNNIGTSAFLSVSFFQISKLSISLDSTDFRFFDLQ